jgi:DNA-binding LacI/PurR family transcriptional regulator
MTWRNAHVNPRKPARPITFSYRCLQPIHLPVEDVAVARDDVGAGSGRRTTLADVARQAGVSTTLVSLVMRGVPGASPANRENVFRVARELGYVPDSRARALRQGRSQLLGVMFGAQQPFHADLVEGIYTAAEVAGYDVVLSAVTDTRGEDRAVRTLFADRCEALILLGPQSSRDWLSGVAGRLPTVVVARSVRHAGIDVIRTAEAEGIGLAVDHLVALHHSDIRHIDGGAAPGADQRRRGYRAAMQRHGLEPRLVHGGPSEREAARATEGLLATGPPTGVLAFNDRCATGVLDTLHRAGVHVPGEVSVVGFDDTHLAGFSHIDLTTVRQHAALMATLAVERAIARADPLQDVTTSREQVVLPTLVVRGSSAPARTGFHVEHAGASRAAGRSHP